MVKSFKAYDNIDETCDKVIFEHEAEGLQEAEYQGKKVKLNDPIRGGSKKFYVYVKDGDKIKKVSFGDTTGLSIKRDDPARRKSFRARHKCGEKKSKLKAQYWACKVLWAGKGGSKKSNPSNRQGKY